MHSTGEGPGHTVSQRSPGVEELLRGFGARAEELLQSKERMAGLLEAVVALAEDLSLDAVLNAWLNRPAGYCMPGLVPWGLSVPTTR